MSTLNDTDLFLVEHDGQNYQITSDQMSTLNDTDLLLVEREGVQYKLEAQDLDLVPPEVPVVSGTIADLGVSAGRFTDEQFKIDISVQEAAKRTDQEVKPYVVATYVPQSDLNGLRFDSARSTRLTRSKSSITTYTLSFWLKPTRVASPDQRIFQDDTGTSSFVVYLGTGNGTIFAGSNVGYASGAVTKNVWQHCVVSYDGSVVKLYINGVLADSITAAFTLSSAGWRFSGASSGSFQYDGYLSEVYFAEEVLPATAFGGPVDSVWLPKSSAEIIDNINNAPKLPDGLSDTSQVWSSGTDPSGWDQPITNLFDGSLETRAYANSGTGATCTWNSIEANTSIRVWGYQGSDGNWQLIINGANVNIPFSTDENWATMPVTYPCQLSGIYNNGEASARAIEVDGRILVDTGVWDASQNWSGGSIVGTTNAAGTWDRAFDGDLTTDTFANGGTSTLTFTTPLNYTSNVEIYGLFLPTGTYGASSISVNGSVVSGFGESSASADATWVTALSGTGTLSSLTTTNYGLIFAVRVDGAILVDAGATWNTSQVWSAGLSADTGGTTVNYDGNAFDGSTESWTYVEPAAIDLIFAPAGGINYTDKVEVWLRGNAQRAQINSNPFVQVPGDNPADGAWLTVVSGSSGTLNTLRINHTSGSNTALNAVRIDGEILVDKASFGANGFYLPFDPSNTGAIYSSGVTASAGTLASNLAFNGAGGYTKSGATGDQAITVTMPANTSGTSFSWDTDGEATIAGQESNPTNVVVQTSTGNYTYNFPTTGGGVVSTETITFTQSTITAVVFTKPAAMGGTIGFKNPKVTGKLLIDHNSIGVDASGNQNNFYDQNFALNTTGGIYTGSYTGSPYEGDWNNVFNGVKGANSASTVATFTSSGDTTMTLTTPFSGNLTIYASANSGPTAQTPTGSEVVLTTANGDVSVPCEVYATGNPAADHGISVGAVSNVTAITLKQSSRGTKLYWLELDGVLLVDANQQDTVTDTPLKSYAVLNEGTNGNLVGINASQDTGASTVEMTGDKYYVEYTWFSGTTGGIAIGAVDITDSYRSTWESSGSGTTNLTVASGSPPLITTGDLIGVAYDLPNNLITFFKNGTEAFTASPNRSLASGSWHPTAFGSPNGIAVNFGQQPFVASNVTYDQATGIATIGGVEYNTLFQEAINSGSSGGSGSSPSGSYSSGRLYLVLDGSGNVTDMQSEDPGYVVLGNAKEYTITWPSLLPSGETPDTELPEGTQICAEVQSTNDSGSDGSLTNHLTPT